MSSALDFLKAKIEKQSRDEKSYSIRGISKRTGVSAGALCEILSGRRTLTKKTALRISDGLNLNITERVKLLRYFGEGVDQPIFEPIQADADQQDFYSVLQEHEYKLICGWEHYAILSLMETKDFNPDPTWIAKRLGIDIGQTNQALDRLIKLDIIQRVKSGFRKKRRKLTTTGDIPSEAIRNAHRNSYILASSALNQTPVELRDMSAITITFDKSKMKRARRLIQDFRRNFAHLMEQDCGDEVYQLHLSFFPLTRSFQ